MYGDTIYYYAQKPGMNHIAKLWLYQNEMKWPQEVADTCNQVGGYINETSLSSRWLHAWVSPQNCTHTLLIFNNYEFNNYEVKE